MLSDAVEVDGPDEDVLIRADPAAVAGVSPNRIGGLADRADRGVVTQEAGLRRVAVRTGQRLAVADSLVGPNTPLDRRNIPYPKVPSPGWLAYAVARYAEIAVRPLSVTVTDGCESESVPSVMTVPPPLASDHLLPPSVLSDTTGL